MKNVSIENKISTEVSHLFVRYGDNPEKLAGALRWLIFKWYIKGLTLKKWIRKKNESGKNHHGCM